jgi:hypothetical protein
LVILKVSHRLLRMYQTQVVREAERCVVPGNLLKIELAQKVSDDEECTFDLLRAVWVLVLNHTT